MMEFKPCPFCGSENTALEVEFANFESVMLHRVKCRDCGASSDWFTRDINATNAWNSRTPAKNCKCSEIEDEVLAKYRELCDHVKSTLDAIKDKCAND